MFFLCWLKTIIIFVQLSKHTKLGMGCFSSVGILCAHSLFAVYGSVYLFWPQCLFGKPLSCEGEPLLSVATHDWGTTLPVSQSR